MVKTSQVCKDMLFLARPAMRLRICLVTTERAISLADTAMSMEILISHLTRRCGTQNAFHMNGNNSYNNSPKDTFIL